MNVFLDTNIALDFLLQREDFFQDAKKVIALCLNRGYNLYLSSVSFANISYIARKGYEGQNVNVLLSILREMVLVAPADQVTVDKALDLNFDDFEDAMQLVSALSVCSDYVITRNVDDFPKSQSFVPVMTPSEFLAVI